MKPIKYFRNPFFGILWVALALHFFNISIDAKDQYPDYVHEDLSFNDIESVTEFLAEVVMGWQNTFSEQEEHDNHDGGMMDINKFFFSKAFVILSLDTAVKGDIDFCIRDSSSPPPVTSEINSPPPKG